MLIIRSIFFMILLFINFCLLPAQLKNCFFHQAEATDKLLLFWDEQVPDYSIKQKIDNNQKTIDIYYKQSQLKEPKNYSKNSLSCSVKQERNQVHLAINYKEDSIILEPQTVYSERFGHGLLFKFHKKAAYKMLEQKNKLLYRTSVKNNKNNPARIFIDCGHGGTDKGAIGITGIEEKQVTQAVGAKLAALCKKAGFLVKINPEHDLTTPLDQRTYLANKFHADLFISLHADSSCNPARQGISLRMPTLKLFKPALLELASISPQSAFILSQEELRYNQSKIFADQLCKLLPEKLSTFNRIACTIHEDPFQVLTGTQMPAVLIEMGFLSNHKECALLAQESYQQSLAEALCNAICSYFKI